MPEQVISLPLVRREAALTADSFNEAESTISVVWTTGAKVRRRKFSFFDEGEEFDEELVVDAKAVRLNRLNDGAPFLAAHNSRSLDSVLGTVVPGTARIEAGMGTARPSSLRPLLGDSARRVHRADREPRALPSSR